MCRLIIALIVSVASLLFCPRVSAGLFCCNWSDTELSGQRAAASRPVIRLSEEVRLNGQTEGGNHTSSRYHSDLTRWQLVKAMIVTLLNIALIYVLIRWVRKEPGPRS